eukprot:5446990-Prorocentrum_lima.AAC.1
MTDHEAQPMKVHEQDGSNHHHSNAWRILPTHPSGTTIRGLLGVRQVQVFPRVSGRAQQLVAEK